VDRSSPLPTHVAWHLLAFGQDETRGGTPAPPGWRLLWPWV